MREGEARTEGILSGGVTNHAVPQADLLPLQWMEEVISKTSLSLKDRNPMKYTLVRKQPGKHEEAYFSQDEA